MSGTDGLDDSSETHLTERRRAGMPPNTFRAVVAIVVVLLLINVYAVYLLVDFPAGEIEEEDDGPEVIHPWNRMIEPVEIWDEVIWEGLEGRLEAPVRVMDGGHLTLVDSDIDLLQDDRLWFNGTYFDVEPGGTLEIVDSTIEVVSSELDPNILVGPYDHPYYIPVISRVVNLASTSEPLLSFDLQWFFNGTPLTVAIQPTPESALMTLESLDPQGPCQDWEHYEYSLEYYVDTTPRVVIYLPEYPDDVFMVRNLNVTDGGMDLPFDLPNYLDTWAGGWTNHGFLTLRNAMSRPNVLPTIILNKGDVIVKGSTISVPIGQERWGSSTFDKENKYGSWWNRNWQVSVSGMEIRSLGGNLTIEGSYLENVPVEANDTRVSVLNTQFTSGYDMLTLHLSSGVVEGSTFEFTGIGEGLRYWDEENGRALWAISVENNSEKEPLVVRDCRFENVQQAIDISYANVLVEGCVFEGVTKLAIWDHRSEGIDGWEHLASGNSFRSCTGFLYLKTGITYISYNGTVDFWRGDEVLDTDGEPIIDYGVLSYLGFVRNHDDGTHRLIRPDVLVETEQRVRVVDYINVSVWGESTYPTYFNGYVNFSVQSGSESIHVDMYQLLMDKGDQGGSMWDNVRSPITVRAVEPVPYYAEEAYLVAIEIGVRYLYASNVTLDIYLDDRFLFQYNETEIFKGGVKSGRVNLYPVIDFEPGTHDLTFVVSGNLMLDSYNISEERTEIENSTFRFMRATEYNTSEEVREFLGSNYVYLLMDEGTSFDLDGLEPFNLTAQEHSITISAMNHTSLTLRNMDYQDMGLVIIYQRPLNITIVDSDLPDLSIYQDELAEEFVSYLYQYPFTIVSSLTIENSTLGSTDLYLAQQAIRIYDTTISRALWITATYNATLEMANTHVVDGYNFMIMGAIGSISIKDCSFSLFEEGGFYIKADGLKEISVVRSIFENCNLMITLSIDKYYDWDLVVADCEFDGLGSYLAVLWDFQDKKNWEQYPSTFPVPNGTIDRNTFSGQSSGMVLHHDLFGELLGDNDLKDGASIWAWYRPQISTAPMEDGYVDRTYNTILSTEPYIELMPFEPNWTIKTESYYLDVTDDPRLALEPEPFHVVVKWSPPQGYTFVVAFGEIDMTVDTNVILYPIWPDLQGTLTDYIDDWPWPIENYRGPYW